MADNLHFSLLTHLREAGAFKRIAMVMGRSPNTALGILIRKANAPIETRRSVAIDSPPSVVSNGILDGEAKIQIKRENPQERDARLHKEAEDAKFGRWKDLSFTLITAIGSICIVIFCLSQIADPNVSAESKAQAWSLLTLIIGGFLGFVTGKGTQ